MNKIQWFVFGFMSVLVIPIVLGLLRFKMVYSTEGVWMLHPLATISVLLGITFFVCGCFEKNVNKK